MRDPIKMDEIDEERERWVVDLDEEEAEVCRLASSLRGGDPCTIFQPRRHGAFNVCFFVEFASPAERWVIRTPIPVSTPQAMFDEKTEIELATMRQVGFLVPSPFIHPS
jgi:hypothetical protein